MIRDKIVVGLLDANLSMKLQMDPELTLEKATTATRQSELVKNQQEVVRVIMNTSHPIYVTRHEKTVLMCTQNLTTFLDLNYNNFLPKHSV